MSRINIMALRHSAFYSPLLMTMAGGYLAEEGLDYHYQIASPQNPLQEGLLQGRVHVAQSAVAVGFTDLEKGRSTPLRHFAQINSRDGFFLAARQRDADFSWSSLHGKQVLVDHLFQPLAMLKYALHKQGMRLSDLQVIDAGNVEQMDTAFRNGLGEVIHQQGPAPQQLEKDGMARVVASVGEVIGPVAFSSLCATEAWLQTDMAEAFVRAYSQALRYVVAAPPAEIAAREKAAGFFANIDDDVLVDTIRTYQNLGCWEPSPVISQQSYTNLLEVFLFDGLISKPYDYNEVISLPPGLDADQAHP